MVYRLKVETDNVLIEAIGIGSELDIEKGQDITPITCLVSAYLNLIPPKSQFLAMLPI